MKRSIFAACCVLVLMVGQAGHTPSAEAKQPAKPNAPTATPIVGGTSFATAVAVTPGVEYSGSISDTTKAIDAFYVDVQPGQLIVVTATSDVGWGNGEANFHLYDQDHGLQLFQPSTNGNGVTGPEQTRVLRYTGNTTTPTRYYFRAERYGSQNGLKAYTFKITLSDQRDAGQSGDAGDTAATARVITPTLGNTATYTGTLGQADIQDWLRIPAPSGAVITAQVSIESFSDPIPCVSGTLYDQATKNLAALTQMCRASTSQGTFIWRANNSTPSAFLIKLDTGSVSNGGLPARYKIDVTMTQAEDAAQLGDAGDALGEARAITPTLGSTTAYSATLGGSDTDDWFRIPAASGQIISVTVIVDDFAGGSGFSAKLHDQAGTQLDSENLGSGSASAVSMRWMANASTPSAFLLHVGPASNNTNPPGQPVRYRVLVNLSQQTDTTQTGDAGDSFDTARPISATPDYLGNQIGFSDKDDFFKMQVPQDALNTPYKFFLKDVAWPANSTGRLTIRRFTDNRQQLGEDIVINAPATETGQFDMCNGCFVRVSYDDKFVVGYTVRLLVIKVVYLPLVRK